MIPVGWSGPIRQLVDIKLQRRQAHLTDVSPLFPESVPVRMSGCGTSVRGGYSTSSRRVQAKLRSVEWIRPALMVHQRHL